MEERLAALEASIAALQRRVEALAIQLAAAEHQMAGLPAVRRSTAGTRVVTPPTAERSDLSIVLGLTGRSLIVLGGAYLVRALTEGHTVPALLGVCLGLLYAIGWFFAAGRAATLKRHADATFHGIVGTLIAFPLIVEATVRFQFLSPTASAVALAALAAFALTIAWYTGHQPTAWCVTVGALGSTIALIMMTSVLMPFAVFLLLLGLATLWLGYDREWIGLRWPVALLADLVAVGLVVRATYPEPRDEPRSVLAMLFVLVAGYVASVSTRTLVRGRNVIPFEVVQTAAVLLVGLGGAFQVARAGQSGVGALAAIALALGGASYTLAFAFVDRRQGLGVNFYFYSSLAVVCTLVGLPLLLDVTGVAFASAALAIASTVLARRLDRGLLTLHSAVYVFTAASTSGVASQAAIAYLTHAQYAAIVPAWAGVAALVVALTCALMPITEGMRARHGWVEGVRAAKTLIFAWCAGGAAIAVALWLGALVMSRPVEPDGIAVTRTVILSASSLLLSLAGRAGCLAGARQLAYLLLLVTGMQLLFEDLGEAGPGLLVIAFATYGIALILVPRISRRRPTEQPVGKPEPRAEV